MAITISVTLFLAANIFLSVNCLDIDRAMANENMPCFVPKKTMDVNITWITSVNTWYFPHQSVLDLYLQAMVMFGKDDISDVTEAELYYDACITYHVGGGQESVWAVEGFGGKRIDYTVEPIKGIEIYNWWALNGKTDHRGTVYTTLTDNESFQFLTTCQEGRMTWGVITTVPELPHKTVKQIYKHAEKIGYKKEHFTGLRYDHCQKHSLKNNEMADAEGQGGMHKNIEL